MTTTTTTPMTTPRRLIFTNENCLWDGVTRAGGKVLGRRAHKKSTEVMQPSHVQILGWGSENALNLVQKHRNYEINNSKQIREFVAFEEFWHLQRIYKLSLPYPFPSRLCSNTSKSLAVTASHQSKHHLGNNLNKLASSCKWGINDNQGANLVLNSNEKYFIFGEHVIWCWEKVKSIT